MAFTAVKDSLFSDVAGHAEYEVNLKEPDESIADVSKALSAISSVRFT